MYCCSLLMSHLKNQPNQIKQRLPKKKKRYFCIYGNKSIGDFPKPSTQISWIEIESTGGTLHSAGNYIDDNKQEMYYVHSCKSFLEFHWISTGSIYFIGFLLFQDISYFFKGLNFENSTFL